MNKYSSKAVKTAATVGMSLAMVLSAVPAVGNATVAQAAIKDVVSARTPSKAIASARVVFPVPGAPIRTMFLISFAE